MTDQHAPDSAAHEPFEQHDPYAGPTRPEHVGLSEVQLAGLARAKRAAVWAGLIVPLALVAVYVAVLLTWMPRLPDPLASHWSGSGDPDGFSSPMGLLFFTAGMSAGMALLIGCIAVLGSGKGEIAVWSGMNRFMAAFSLAMSVSLGLMGVFIAHSQLGLADAHDAGGVGGVVALAFGIGITLGVLAYALQPNVYVAGPAKRAAQPMQLAPTERAVWIGSARPSTVFIVAIGGSMLALGVGTAAEWAALSSGIAGAETPFWIMLGTTVLIGLLLAATFSFKVRVDASGIEVRSRIGWPVFRVVAADVSSAVATRIAPLAEFGGWGIRWSPGRTGIVLRTGEGLIVKRHDGRILAVTIDSADTAAALLMAYATAAASEGEPNE